MPRRLRLLSTAAAFTLLLAASAFALDENDWPWWRGPNRTGIAAAGQQPPVEWSESTNVRWKTTVPGRGHSSPILVGNQIFLTTADKDEQTQSVVAFDRETGELLWQTELNRGGFAEKIHSKNTHATPTVACDGETLYVVFPNHGRLQLAALSLAGKKLWEIDAGPFVPKKYEFGYAPSPLLHGGNVIVASEFEQGYIAAFSRRDGSEVWRIPRTDNISFSSPIVARIADRDQMLISGADHVSSFDPRSGKLLWKVKGTSKATCGTIVWDGDIVFASGGYPESQTIAIRADGSGEILWSNGENCYEQSMIASDGYLYAVNDRGIAFCWNGTTGEEMWKKRLGGPVSSSPVLAGGNIYATNEKGTTFVFRASPESFQLVAENQLGDEGFATPTICGGRIYMRTASSSGGDRVETLYCLDDQ
ncbi:outer membrane biogenesis protein BamB [Maioricimonas rarisocia]|uniref:Outer membrane biogenesis protein BamB n=1 Tax=Maioricimonas rarisocia TaxID=2528026 RepID=A0A517Z8B7_9PLAN|nr:PQQ-binding-like beta-propeller repeat protein [Maioricimonas rarisocia]QDU38703.1 outer membrane biogenesis protein BamB [Maioricimonas rarisocia]